MSGALDGIRVIDFGQYIAAPLAGQLLADQGADVIRVDPPSGPSWQTPANATWNRGKRSIALDLKQPDDAEAARRLVLSADVLVENFRPGVMDRLGLGADALTSGNPGLVYLSLPGFGADDDRAATPAWEGVVGAATATYRPNAEEGGDQPIYTAIPIASVYGALLGVTSVTMALNARERDGRGQRIEMPLHDAMFPAVGLYGLKVIDGPPRPLRGGPWVRQYECQDGRWVQFHAANSRFIEQFVDAAGVESWRADDLTNRVRVAAEPDLAAEVQRRLEDLFKTKPSLEWEELVNAAGTPTAVCRPSAEWLEHPQAIESEMVIEVDDPDLGPTKQPGIQARLMTTPGTVRGPAPRLDADRKLVLAKIETNGQRPSIVGPEDLRAALDGVKVLDLCIILAGPTCGRTLAEFGADVIKIDNPSREGGVAFHNDVNRAKRSILLDLKTDAGRELFWELVDQTDVVVQNYRKGVVGRLGIDYESVKARKPDIVYASLNAYGHKGPWAERPGWEQLAQATTGMQERFGSERPVLQPYAINDYGTGISGAYAVALALLHRQKTGEGQHVDAALAYTACTLQSVFLQDFEGKKWEEPGGQDSLGEGPLQRLYQASDGWFFCAAPDRERLAGVEGLDGTAGFADAELTTELATRFRSALAATWVERLLAAGCGAHRALNVDELMDAPRAQERGLSLTREHDGAGLIRTTGAAPMLSRTPVRAGRAAPAPGADAASILAEIGHEADLPRLVADGVVVTEGVPTI